MQVKVLFGGTHDPNILYLTRTHLDNNVLALKLEDDKIILVVSESDYGRASIQCSHARVMQHSDFEHQCSSVSEMLLSLYERYSGTMIIMPFTFPVGLFVKMKELSPSIPMQIVRDQMLLSERLCKTPMEVQYIRDAVRAAAVAFALIEDILRRSNIEMDPAAGCIPKELNKPHTINFPQFTDGMGSGHVGGRGSETAAQIPASISASTPIPAEKTMTFRHPNILGPDTEGLETQVAAANSKYILRDPKTNEIVTSTYLRNLVRMELTNLGYFLESCIISCGKQACDPFCHGQGNIRPNELIVCDIYPRCIGSGYYGDMTRTFLKGKPNGEQHKMMETVLHAHRIAIKEIMPGRLYHELHDIVSNIFTSLNYVTKRTGSTLQGFCHGLGHGVGLEVYEPPFIDANHKSGVCTVGNVFTIEPGLYYPHIGGCRVEDVVIVTEKGAEVLSSYSYNWIIP